LLCRVVWYKFTDVKEVLAAFIIRASTRLHGASTKKTVIFILDAVRNLNLIKVKLSLVLNYAQKDVDVWRSGGIAPFILNLGTT
jgi:hypothetical protein